VRDQVRTGRQRLSAVQDELDRGQVMGADVLADPLDDLRRHPVRLIPPPLVRHLVHVAVVARQVAPERTMCALTVLRQTL
jgi:hypothetical protein